MCLVSSFIFINTFSAIAERSGTVTSAKNFLSNFNRSNKFDPWLYNFSRNFFTFFSYIPHTEHDDF